MENRNINEIKYALKNLFIYKKKEYENGLYGTLEMISDTAKYFNSEEYKNSLNVYNKLNINYDKIDFFVKSENIYECDLNGLKINFVKKDNLYYIDNYASQWEKIKL